MKKDKRTTGFTLLILLILIILSIRIFLFISPDEKKENNNEENKIVFEQNHSIYNGTDPEIIAERFAEALKASPIISKKIETCCPNEKQYEFWLQNDNHFTIKTTKLSSNITIINKMSLSQAIYNDINNPIDNITAQEIVLTFAKRFLLEFGIDMAENYSISVIPKRFIESWHVDIYQIYSGKFLNESGFHADVNWNNGEIRTMEIKDWLDPKSPININISIDEGREIIFKECENRNFSVRNPYNASECRIEINLSNIEYVEYSVFHGRLGYTYKIHYQFNETDKCLHKYLINIENGKKLKWFREHTGGSSGSIYLKNL